MNLADALAVARALAAVPVVWLTLGGDRWPAFALFVLAAGTDALDGIVARRAGTPGPRGAYLDPLADKALVLCTLVALSLAGGVPWPLVALISLREIAALALRTAAYAGGAQARATTIGKLKTVCEMSGVAFLLVPDPPRLVSLAGTGLLVVALAIGLATLPSYLPRPARRVT